MTRAVKKALEREGRENIQPECTVADCMKCPAEKYLACIMAEEPENAP